MAPLATRAQSKRYKLRDKRSVFRSGPIVRVKYKQPKGYPKRPRLSKTVARRRASAGRKRLGKLI